VPEELGSAANADSAVFGLAERSTDEVASRVPAKQRYGFCEAKEVPLRSRQGRDLSMASSQGLVSASLKAALLRHR